MTGKTHQVIGLTTGLSTYLIAIHPLFGPATFAWVLVLSSVGALLPDIDQPGSRLWNSLPFGHLGGELINPFLQHRNLTHSLLGSAGIAALSYYLLHLCPPYWGLHLNLLWVCFLAAYLSHLVADMVTIEGIPLFFPYQKMYGIPPFPFQGLRIKTGAWFENLVVFPVTNLILVALIWTHFAEIQTLLFHS